MCVTRTFEDALADRLVGAGTGAAADCPQGCTEGSLFVLEGYLSLPVLQ